LFSTRAHQKRTEAGRFLNLQSTTNSSKRIGNTTFAGITKKKWLHPYACGLEKMFADIDVLRKVANPLKFGAAVHAESDTTTRMPLQRATEFSQQ
jgi:hypothetical protein